MSARFLHRLQVLSQEENISSLEQIGHGIEKEGLRVTPETRLSEAPHPGGLGSALTHPHITTDYSEALLEFITPVYQHPEEALAFLEELHCEAMRQMPDGETIWGTSMPPILNGDDSIPVAQYGNSNSGLLKHIYRQGLAWRYGKAMQTIAGIHYNFSLSRDFWCLMKESEGSELSPQDYQSAGYFALIRNFRRYSWLLSYLFGASPALDKSFLDGQVNHDLEHFDDDTLYLPWATSLRMSDLGYSNHAQSDLQICYNTLDNYVQSLWKAIHTPYKPYEKIGIRVNGDYRQLNTNLLQIENEYYSSIRPKRVIQSGEKPVQALRERGVEYIEVRSLDINPLLPLGIDEVQSRFLDVFLVYCVLSDSPDISSEECSQVVSNFSLSVCEGRRPDLLLNNKGTDISLIEWGNQLFDQLLPVAELLDVANRSSLYTESLNAERKKLDNVDLTPSAVILSRLNQGQSFREFSRDITAEHAARFNSMPGLKERQDYFSRLAAQSHTAQQAREESDSEDFETFLQNYFRE
ncbi:glutamate--cysteine ligase [Sansalvadorimonas sp. 2012CJ34-2]|uniref:Glutamate--cysteine ligase n=1 Tax=Parendozoicomonas callyspongiae TaxID=2942213 RepID=A0ABT0PIF4_9GAMM|nr:glutamate--cysteine ligase [Sansalvadorimonas sp. 2012CJ34-2]MCL6271172.1 glutamate--cysteine ligase [Sansalvadorimonas sp. 2012CJ34-2]